SRESPALSPPPPDRRPRIPCLTNSDCSSCSPPILAQFAVVRISFPSQGNFIFQTTKKPRSSGALRLTEYLISYSTMICVGCDPFATATAQVGNPDDGNG